MPGLFAVIGNTAAGVSNQGLVETIDPFLWDQSIVVPVPHGTIGLSWKPDNPLGRSVFSDDADMPAFFCGDLVDYSEVPWGAVRDALRAGRRDWFTNFKGGTFILSAFDARSRTVHFVSDRLSMQAACYTASGGRFVLSTALATLCRLAPSPDLSREWLYEFLHFNYPLGTTAPLAGAKRLPPASVLSVDIDSLETSLASYAEPFSRPTELLRGRAGMEKALEVFRDRLPRYYSVGRETAVSLTAGMDSRTVLAYAPDGARERMTTYTYGVPGSYDLVDSARTAEALAYPHVQIPFDENFTRGLRDLIGDTIFLSGGLERAHRATLPYVYGSLTGGGRKFPVTLTGLSGDHLFRDHINGTGNIPAMIPASMMVTLRTGEVNLDDATWSRAFPRGPGDFKDHVHRSIEGIWARYGEPGDPATYLRFLVYETAPKYFGGEYSIARHFTALRSPFWDQEIISLAFGVEYGTLGFSELLPRKDTYREKVLQAYLIRRAGRRGGSRIGGIPVWAYSANSKPLYHASRLLWKLPGKIRKTTGRLRYSPLEDWRRWLFSAESDDMSRLLGTDPMLSEHLTTDFIDKARKGGDVVLLGKLITAEAVLRLIATRWADPRKGRRADSP